MDLSCLHVVQQGADMSWLIVNYLVVSYVHLRLPLKLLRGSLVGSNELDLSWRMTNGSSMVMQIKLVT